MTARTACWGERSCSRKCTLFSTPNCQPSVKVWPSNSGYPFLIVRPRFDTVLVARLQHTCGVEHADVSRRYALALSRWSTSPRKTNRRGKLLGTMLGSFGASSFAFGTNRPATAYTPTSIDSFAYHGRVSANTRRAPSSSRALKVGDAFDTET